MKLKHQRKRKYSAKLKTPLISCFNEWRSFQSHNILYPAITVFHHDSESEVEVTCEDPRCHKRNIHYEALLEQMLFVVDQSGDCDQYIKVTAAPKLTIVFKHKS